VIALLDADPFSIVSETSESGESTRRVLRLAEASNSTVFCSTTVVLEARRIVLISSALFDSTVVSFDDVSPGPDKNEKDSSSSEESAWGDFSGRDVGVVAESERIARVGDDSVEDEVVLFTEGRGGGMERRGEVNDELPSVWRAISSAGVSGRLSLDVFGLGKRCFILI